MNVEINEKLIEDSQKIDIGIRKLQSKLADVIDRITDKNADPKEIIDKYKNELAAIKTDLTEFLQQQEEFDESLKSAEKEVNMIGEEVRKIISQHNITVDEDVLKAQTQFKEMDIK